MTPPIWFSSWSDLLHIAVKAVGAYALVVFFIRLCGKRATSRMNNFDWIVTVAVGSLFASTVLVKDVSLAEGALAIGLLLALQFAVTLATSRWEWARTAVLAPPSLLYFRGRFLRDAMLRERVSRNEILSAIRESGAASLDKVDAVILESDADLAVVSKDEGSVGECLTSLPGYGDISEPERGDSSQR